MLSFVILLGLFFLGGIRSCPAAMYSPSPNTFVKKKSLLAAGRWFTKRLGNARPAEPSQKKKSHLNRNHQRTSGYLIARKPVNDNAIGRGFLIPPFFWIVFCCRFFGCLSAVGGAAFDLVCSNTQWLGFIFRDTNNLFDCWNVSFLAWITPSVDNFLAPPPFKWLVT